MCFDCTHESHNEIPITHTTTHNAKEFQANRKSCALKYSAFGAYAIWLRCATFFSLFCFLSVWKSCVHHFAIPTKCMRHVRVRAMISCAHCEISSHKLTLIHFFASSVFCAIFKMKIAITMGYCMLKNDNHKQINCKVKKETHFGCNRKTEYELSIVIWLMIFLNNMSTFNLNRRCMPVNSCPFSILSAAQLASHSHHAYTNGLGKEQHRWETINRAEKKSNKKINNKNNTTTQRTNEWWRKKVAV